MSARSRRLRRMAKPKAGKFIALSITLIAVAFVAALVVATVDLMDSWLEDLPDYTDEDAYLLSESTKIYDADGNIIAEYFTENRIPITREECSDYIMWATVAIEDERYYSHNGVDLYGITRAVVAQLIGSNQGASTITQQLVRNTILKDEQFEQTLSRKTREAFIALGVETMYDKDEILMMYLNSIYYGSGCYGVEAASEYYFSKSCIELTIPEAAMLAGLAQSPSLYDPTVNPELALERRNIVLEHMYDQGYITEQEFEDAVATMLSLNIGPYRTSGAIEYPYFVQYVMDELTTMFTTDTIYGGGLTIMTTIQPSTQAAAESAVNSVLDYAYDDLASALIALDPDTGYIVAMVGGSDYSVSQYNLATQAVRQPGSTFKLFTLVTAIEAGINPSVVINGDQPITIGEWTVENNEEESYGNITLRQATLWSVNTVYAQVAEIFGSQAIADTAYRMGVKTELEIVQSLVIGSSEVTVLDMASAYSVLATGGIYHEPEAITQILDRNGNVLYEANTEGTRVISAEVSAAVTNILEEVVASGTGVEAQIDVDQPVAGKTGTTDNTTDLWFVGYTPQITAAVWVGYPTTTSTIYYRGQVGSTHTLPNVIFSRFMTAALQGVPREEFPTAASPYYVSNSAWSFSHTSYYANR